MRAALLPLIATAALGCSSEGSVIESKTTSDLVVGSVSSALSSTVDPVASFGSNPGGLKLYAYVPKPLPANAPLVLVLHGCMQGASDAATWGWNELADQYGFVVGYPEQQTNNNSMRCFNWGGVYGNLDSLQRGKGENESIKEMVDTLVAANGLDAKRVYIAGFSAGGGTALVAAATWPDVFAGVASLSGIPYKCNASYSEVFSCQNPGVDRTAADWGDRVRSAFPSFTGPYPRVSIWQGASDQTVGTKNRVQIIRQWTNVHGLAETATATDTVDGAKHETFADGSGQVLVESYEVPGMNHGVAVAPSKQCGATSTYAFDKGICQAQRVIEFFGIANAASTGGDAGTTGGDSGTTAPTGTTPPGSTPPGSAPPGSAPPAGKAGDGGATAFADHRTAGSTCSTAPGRASSASSFFVAVGLALAAFVSRRRSIRGSW